MSAKQETRSAADARPDRGSRASGARRSGGAFATIVALTVILAGLGLVGRDRGGWPLVLWVMYSNRAEMHPKPEKAVLQLRGRTRAGDAWALFPWELLGPEQKWFPRVALTHAFDDADPELRDRYRAYLVHVAERSLRTEIERIDAWRVTWSVEPLELPPLQVDEPIAETWIGAFSAREPGFRTLGRDR